MSVHRTLESPISSASQRAPTTPRVVMVGGDVQPVGVGEAEIGLHAALHLQRVLLPGGDDHADVEPVAGQQPVEHRGAAEHGRADLRERLRHRRVPLAHRVVGRHHQPAALVLGGRLRLADHEVAGLVDDEGVRHRPARVDRQDPGGVSCGAARRHAAPSHAPVCRGVYGHAAGNARAAGQTTRSAARHVGRRDASRRGRCFSRLVRSEREGVPQVRVPEVRAASAEMVTPGRLLGDQHEAARTIVGQLHAGSPQIGASMAGRLQPRSPSCTPPTSRRSSTRRRPAAPRTSISCSTCCPAASRPTS